MQLNHQQIRRIVNELFRYERQAPQRELVYIVATEGCSVYEAEKRTGVVQNTGTRYTKVYFEHVKYLEELEALGD